MVADKEQFLEMDYEEVLRNCYFMARMHRLNHHDAENVAQEAVIKVWKGRDTYDPTKGRLETWINAIARNSIVNHFRKSSRELTNSLYNSSAFIEPPDICNKWGESKKANSALDFILKKGLQVTVLRDVKGLKYREIADILEVPLGTVKSRLSRERNLVKEYLKRQAA